MYSKEEALAKITSLVKRFEDQINTYTKSDYNETLTRRDFIDPLFEALGWDIDNKQGASESYREVIHEDKIKIGGATKAPDYSFRLTGGKRLFFVEAKKPSVAVKDDILPAYQVRRYGWSAKLAISIITDFEEFSVYDCTKKPNPTDKASVARIKYITFKEYISDFDFLWNTFSKEKVIQGSFDTFIKSDTNKKGTTTVDKEFLNSLDNWRTSLATNISKTNLELDEDEINFAVQQFIDRIIFLRIAEDRAVEEYGSLKEIVNKPIAKAVDNEYYTNLVKLYMKADDKYNSGIFDFKKDQISTKLRVDNKVVKAILTELYYPECPYEFSVLSVEILGSAYEQFLGKQIKIDKNHRAKIDIERKPDVIKAGGVFYTPAYIVDYIVKQTVGKLIEDKTPKEVEKIRVIDPACGSGSFLIGAYQHLLDWHKNYYTTNKKTWNLKESPLTPDGNLTTGEKKRILLNNIHGVDIDVNAVEVTKLSLLLKCMEGETDASINNQLRLFNERVLPTLDDNIKSGNSLIDTDFYDNELDFGGDKKIKPFHWQSAFPAVFKQGGFDAVIGNPPYGAELSNEEQEYCLKKYPIGNTDTAALFIIQSERLMAKKGINGFIIPKSFTYASNWAKTRSAILSNLDLIVDCSKVWKEVKLEMSIYISKKSNPNQFFTSCIRDKESIINIGQIEKNLCNEFDFILNGVSVSAIEIALKIKRNNKTLNDFVTNQRGGMFQSEVVDEKKTSKNYFVLGGKQISRYGIADEAKGVVTKEAIADEKAFIKQNSILAQNIVAHIQNPFPRIQIISTLGEQYNENNYVILDTINQLTNKSNLSSKFILGVLNSRITNWYTYKFIFANAIRTMHFDSTTTGKIPFPSIDPKNKTEQLLHDEIVKNVDLLLNLNEELLTIKLQTKIEEVQSRIERAEANINQAVYKLYGLTEEEIGIVEG
jgi:hypothetical protein